MIDSMQMQQLLQLAFLPLALGHRLTLCQCLYDRLFRVLDLDPDLASRWLQWMEWMSSS